MEASGGSSVHQLPRAAPEVVRAAGRLARPAAIKMGIYDAPVAQDISAYASLVAHFAQNTTANQRLRQRICASNAVLYESERAVGGWEAAIEQLVAAERASAGTGISSDEADLL